MNMTRQTIIGKAGSSGTRLPHLSITWNSVVFGWTASGLWHWIDAANPYSSSLSYEHSWWYGQDTTGTYDTGTANSGALTSPAVYIPDTGYYLQFWYRYDTETQTTSYDQRWIQLSIDGGDFVNAWQLYDDPKLFWLGSHIFDLSPLAGHVLRVRFYFTTLDDYANKYRGWYIDNFMITSTPPPSCPDTIEPNNTVTHATPISYGQVKSGYICPGGDYDFYKFYGGAGDRVVVDIDAQSIGSSLDSVVGSFRWGRADRADPERRRIAWRHTRLKTRLRTTAYRNVLPACAFMVSPISW